MIQFGIAQDVRDFNQIIALQKANIEMSISAADSKDQGFVTVQHSVELLAEMNEPHPHIVVRDRDQIIGYTLVMPRRMRDSIPILIPMFDKIDRLNFAGKALKDSRYFVMGQVCIDKAYRGKGLFRTLYQQMKTRLSDHYDFVITEVATRNTRSWRAHEKVGFKTLDVHFSAEENEEWALIIWDWS